MAVTGDGTDTPVDEGEGFDYEKISTILLIMLSVISLYRIYIGKE